METEIAYINGYLKGFELLNSFVNDSKTYFVEILRKEKDIQDTLSKYYDTKSWKFNVVDTDSAQWKHILMKELKLYFSQIIMNVYSTFNPRDLKSQDLSYIQETRDKIDQVILHYQDHMELLLSEFISILSAIVKDSKFIKIDVDWNSNEGFYECYAYDCIFDLGEEYLYLHFGGSD